MVMPPRGTESKIGVFATRAPYRPNQIGMSLVKLEKIDGLEIHIENHDILDETPILDIKPYLPYCDCIPDANIGWLENVDKKQYFVNFTSIAAEQIQFLERQKISEIKAFIIQQLEFDPTNKKKKRVEHIFGSWKYILSYRTWRIEYTIEDFNIHIQKIFSGYTSAELDFNSPKYEDTYKDKTSHCLFKERFGC